MKNQKKTVMTANKIPLRAYSPPKLKKLGKVSKITLGGGSNGDDGFDFEF